MRGAARYAGYCSYRDGPLTFGRVSCRVVLLLGLHFRTCDCMVDLAIFCWGGFPSRGVYMMAFVYWWFVSLVEVGRGKSVVPDSFGWMCDYSLL